MKRINLILVPVDFSTPSRAALQSAAYLAEKNGATLVVLFVAEPLRGLEALRARMSKIKPAAEEEAGPLLREFVDREVEELVPVKYKVVRGPAWVRIVETAKKLGVDLIVTGTRGETGLTHAILGSTADRVVRHAPCSTLIVHEGKSFAVTANRRNAMKILAPVDFSNQSKIAADQAAAWAVKLGADLDLLYVTPPLALLAEYEGIDFGLLEAQMKDGGAKTLEKWNTRLNTGKLTCRAVLREGRASTEIIAQAKKSGADLIVLATHGYSGLEHVLLGSTAEEVVRRAPCPVLVVRKGR